MLELSGMGSVLRGIGFLYWLLALGAVTLTLRYGKGVRGKAFGVAIAVAVFGYLPGKAMIEQHQRDTYTKEAWAYFKKLCSENSGEKIYKTFTAVKSVLVVKPLPPATEGDLRDQFWYGDPYSNATPWNERGIQQAKRLAAFSRRPDGNLQVGLEFVEFKNDADQQYVRIVRPRSPQEDVQIEAIDKPISRFGVIWEDISTPNDRKYWVAGGRLRVVDLTDNSTVAERVGYLIEAGFGSTGGGRLPWLTTRGPRTSCPSLSGGDYSDTWFIANVFKLGMER